MQSKQKRLTKTQSKERNMKVVEFVSKIPCYSDTIQKIFYSSRKSANEHLKKLFEDGYLKRDRKLASDKYFYYVKPKTHKDHYDIMAKTYYWVLQNGYKILDCKVQQIINGLMPDLYLTISRNGEIGTLAVEIERSYSNIKATIRKYENKGFESVLLVSHLQEKVIENDYIKVLYNINIKELD